MSRTRLIGVGLFILQTFFSLISYFLTTILLSILQTYFPLFFYTSNLLSAFYQNYPITNQPLLKSHIPIPTNFLNFSLIAYCFSTSIFYGFLTFLTKIPHTSLTSHCLIIFPSYFPLFTYTSC